MQLMDMNISEAEPVTRDQLTNKEKKTTGDMLYEVFPRHIADALKAGRKVEPESHEMVTIFFRYVVGSAGLCSQSMHESSFQFHSILSTNVIVFSFAFILQ
jgi:hypothetical protein